MLATAGHTKTADACGSPAMQWSYRERRWCAYLRWAVGFSMSRGHGGAGRPADEITHHILSFVAVDSRSVFSIKLRSGKRSRQGQGGPRPAGDADARVAAEGRGATHSLANASATDDTLMPYFYVEPPFTDALSVFVRISSATVLTDEELNHLFGRYGMTHARRVGVRPAIASAPQREATADAVAAAEEGASPSKAQSSANADATTDAPAADDASAITCGHLQSFIVTLDDNRNCLRAIQEIRQPEIALIAFSRPERNAYCVADLAAAQTLVQTLLRSVVSFQPGTPQFAHVVASLRLAQGVASGGGGDGAGGDGAARASTDLAFASSFVPDLVIDHLPYWTTREQLKERFSLYGTIRSMKLSVDDRNGCFLGAALVRMGSLQESLAASEGLNGAEVSEGWPMTVGVLTEQLDIVSLRTGEVLSACDTPASVAMMARNALEQRRMWV